MVHDMSDEELAREIARMRAAGTDSQRYEVKACRGGLSQDIGRTISGFANGSGGTIVCGLDEASGFAPVEGFDAARVQDALANFCGEKMTPPVRPLIEVRSFEGAPVLVARIPELLPRDKPCYLTSSGCYSGSYIRVGDGDRHLSYYEIDRLISERVQPRYDDGAVDGATIDDLDPALVADLLAHERALRPRTMGAMDDETALRKLHVLKPDGSGTLRPTLAGLVALGAYPQEFFPLLRISFSCYPGTSKTDALPDGRRFTDLLSTSGPIPVMIDEALGAVTRNMRIGGRMEGALRRDVPDYPLMAVREALANALMHRDYSPESLGSAVFVDLYADRLEITSPGGLYGAVTLDSLGSVDFAGSCRNQTLARILESTPLASAFAPAGGYVVENRGTGFAVMIDELERAGKPAPIPRDSPSLFKVTFLREAPAGVDGEPAELIEVPSGKATTPRDRPASGSIEYAIVSLAAERESVSMRELMDELQRSRPTVRKRVADLVQRGVLVTTGAKNSPQLRYRLAQR